MTNTGRKTWISDLKVLLYIWEKSSQCTKIFLPFGKKLVMRCNFKCTRIYLTVCSSFTYLKHVYIGDHVTLLKFTCLGILDTGGFYISFSKNVKCQVLYFVFYAQRRKKRKQKQQILRYWPN